MSHRWLRAPYLAFVIRVAILLGLAASAHAQSAPATAPEAITRHPLELQALTDPEGVRRQLPPLIKRATDAGDFRELALLSLAESNACRVIADWPCQNAAASRASQAGEQANLPELQVRGLILESRGSMALQNFSRASQLLSSAERTLVKYPFPEMSADVYLAYSSLSFTVGKHAVAIEYAQRGLKALGDTLALLIRIRLLRNQARSMAQLNNLAGAQRVLKQAIDLVEKIKDPKLSAELHLEDARIGRLMGDVNVQRKNGRLILDLGKQLSNSQLDGLGHEVLGLAALGAADNIEAEKELRKAYMSFRALKLERDERRVLRALIRSVIGRGIPRAELEALFARSIALEASLEADDRNLAADDFEARLKYAQQELDYNRVEAAATLASQRAVALAEQQRLTLIAAALSLVLLVVFGMLLVLQRRYNARLKKAFDDLQDSESRYRMLAENSRDMVVRMRLDGQHIYVSPAVKDLLGRGAILSPEPQWELIHADDRQMVVAQLKNLGEQGGQATITYRMQHADGHWVWLEALGRLVSAHDGTPAEIVYSARDVTARIRAEAALQLSERNMRAITDNIPAMIAYVDREERYTFVNAAVGKVFGIEPQTIIGRTVRDVRGESIYAGIKQYVDAALNGEASSFEGAGEANGRQYSYQSNFVPDRDQDGNVRGFFALTFDISKLKKAEAKLERLARIDSLTGVANRRYFEEHLANALARSRRRETAMTLLCVDIDHFKLINDTHGHPVGDAVIVAFARRLEACVRADDMVARLGGDEFVLLVENPEPDSGTIIAQKLLVNLQLPLQLEELTLRVSASIGVAYSRHTPAAKDLMSLADDALYQAKAAGRNTFRSASEF